VGIAYLILFKYKNKIGCKQSIVFNRLKTTCNYIFIPMKRIRKSEIPIEVIEIGNRIKKIIVEKNLVSKNVAHDADLDVENLRKYIKGRQEMKVSTMLKIAKALGVTAGELVNGLEIDILEKK
jgi:hypothetical protein